MKTNDLIQIAKGNFYQVVVKDTLNASSCVVHHCLVLREATNIAIAMIKSGFEAFIKEDDDDYKMFYSEVGRACGKMANRFRCSSAKKEFNAVMH